MKSFEDIRDEFLDQLRQKDSELRVELDRTENEKNTLLQRAGIKDGPDNMFADDADRWRDEEYYRRRVREMVFEVPDQELRKQIINKVSDHRYEKYQRWEMRGLFENQFAAKLWAERCNAPPPSGDVIYNFIWLPAIFCVLYWVAYVFSGALDALVFGIGALLPCLVFFAVRYVVRYIEGLHRQDVNLQQAIQYVDQEAAMSKREARRCHDLPEIFSDREMRTGEADKEIA